MNEKREVWLHVHVPKAGGSTLRQLFNRNFDEGYYNSVSLLESKQYTAAEVSEIVRCHPQITCISDHKFSLDLPYDCAHALVRAVAFVRDPVDRFISRYFFHRHFEEVDSIAKRTSFMEFVDIELVKEKTLAQTNSQIYFLNRGRSKTDLDLIADALDTGQAFLFPIERFDDACVCLEQLFPQVFTDLSYTAVNVSQRDQAISNRERQTVADYLKRDAPLIELAHQFLDQTIAVAFSKRAEFKRRLKRFRAVCKRRQDNFSPPP